jgi:hypothetical protein
MLHIELKLETLENEEFEVMDAIENFKTSELSSVDLNVYNSFMSLIGTTRTLIEGTPNVDPIVLFRKFSWNYNDDMSISSEYPVQTVSYESYSESDKAIINSFISLINSL